MKIIHIGFENFVPKEKISMILQIDSRPVNRLITNANKEQKLIDASHGKKRKSVILTTDGYVVLSHIAAKTLAKRFNSQVPDDEDM